MNHSQDESASAYNFTEIVTNAVRTSMCTVSANCVPGPDLPDAFFLQATMAINATTILIAGGWRNATGFIADT